MGALNLKDLEYCISMLAPVETALCEVQAVGTRALMRGRSPDVDRLFVAEVRGLRGSVGDLRRRAERLAADRGRAEEERKQLLEDHV